MDISNMSVDMIPVLATGMSTAKVQNEVSTALTAKVLDTAEQSGAALIDMMRRTMELSVNPNVGSNFDVSI